MFSQIYPSEGHLWLKTDEGHFCKRILCRDITRWGKNTFLPIYREGAVIPPIASAVVVFSSVPIVVAILAPACAKTHHDEAAATISRSYLYPSTSSSGPCQLPRVPANLPRDSSSCSYIPPPSYHLARVSTSSPQVPPSHVQTHC